MAVRARQTTTTGRPAEIEDLDEREHPAATLKRAEALAAIFLLPPSRTLKTSEPARHHLIWDDVEAALSRDLRRRPRSGPPGVWQVTKIGEIKAINDRLCAKSKENGDSWNFRNYAGPPQVREPGSIILVAADGRSTDAEAILSARRKTSIHIQRGKAICCYSVEPLLGYVVKERRRKNYMSTLVTALCHQMMHDVGQLAETLKKHRVKEMKLALWGEAHSDGGEDILRQVESVAAYLAFSTDDVKIRLEANWD